jgi:sugar (pentulose or hexulose) kinase
MVGRILREWTVRSGLPRDVKVWCGLHDSNAALIAARANSQHADMTVLSTGTWFVAMRSGATSADASSLPPERDCLINVDVDGNPVPSARFMGGREIDLLMGSDARHVDFGRDEHALLPATQAVLKNAAMVLPSWVDGAGPFGNSRGRWLSMPRDPVERGAAVCLYAALMTDALLDLIGAKDSLIVEGRFAAAQLFVAALAALRPQMAVYVASAEHDVAFGALKQIFPSFSPPQPLARVCALPLCLDAYRRRWRTEIDSYGPARKDR